MLITGRRVDACLPARRTETGGEIRGELRKEDARSSRLLASKGNRYDRKNWNKKRMNEDGGGGKKRNSRNADIYIRSLLHLLSRSSSILRLTGMKYRRSCDSTGDEEGFKRLLCVLSAHASVMDARKSERRKKGERNELKRHLPRLLVAGETLVERGDEISVLEAANGWSIVEPEGDKY